MEYWFYHLESMAIEGLLPGLLEKTQAKGWRTLVKLPSDKLADMDEYLWTFQDSSFLPHARDDEPLSELQPITLSASADKVDNHQAVVLIDGTDIADMNGVERCIIMINGRSEADVKRERERWKRLKDDGAVLSYYQQNARGGWDKKA